MTLNGDCGADTTTLLTFDWDDAFAPSYITVGSGTTDCLSIPSACPVDKDYEAGKQIPIHFWYTYVADYEPSSEEEDTISNQWFIEYVQIYSAALGSASNIDVYKCTNLNE